MQLQNGFALQVCRTSCPVLLDCLQLANDWTDRGRRPFGVIMAGIRWGVPKNPNVKRAYRPCVCCGTMIPPWVHGNKTRCATCASRKRAET